MVDFSAKKDKPYFLSILKDLCVSYEIDFPTMAAICEHESSWNPYATRYEARFQYLSEFYKYARANKISTDTEKSQQMTSWGLGQLMGANARQMSYDGPLVRLCEPEINLNLVCKFFKKTCDRYPTLEKKISAYNAGSPQYDANGKLKNQDYVDTVMKLMKNYA